MKKRIFIKSKISKKLLSLLVVCLSFLCIFTVGAVGDELTTKALWQQNKISGYGTDWDIDFGVGPSERDILTFSAENKLREYSFNGTAWLDPIPVFDDDGEILKYTADITKQIKTDGKNGDTATVIYVREAAEFSEVTSDPYSGLPIVNAGSKISQGTTRQATTLNAGVIEIPASRGKAPTVSAAFKTAKTGDEPVDSINTALFRAEISQQKDVTYNPADGKIYIKKSETYRNYYFWTVDSVAPLEVPVETGSGYVDSEITDLISGNNAAKISVAYTEKELGSGLQEGTENFGPMSKTATLKIPASPAAPKITIDYNNGVYKGTKAAATEYMIFTDKWEDGISTTETANMPFGDIDGEFAAFRTKATYNKRASHWKVVEIPVSAEISGLTKIEIGEKEYIKVELKKGTSGFAEPKTEEADTEIVGQSVIGDGYSASSIPFAYGETSEKQNPNNTLQYQIIDPEVVNSKGKITKPEKIIKNWTNITWKPMDGISGDDYGVFDVSGTSFTPPVTSESDGYIMKIRVKANVKSTGSVQNIFAPSKPVEIKLSRRAEIGKPLKSSSLPAKGDISFSYDNLTGLLNLVEIDSTKKNFVMLGKYTPYQISLDKKTWYKTGTAFTGSETVIYLDEDNEPYDVEIEDFWQFTTETASVLPTTKTDKLNKIYIRKAETETNSASAIITLTLPTITHMSEEIRETIQVGDVSEIDGVDAEGLIIPAGLHVEISSDQGNTWIDVPQISSDRAIYGYTRIKNGKLIDTDPGAPLPDGVTYFYPDNAAAGGYAPKTRVRIQPETGKQGTPLTFTSNGMAILSIPANPSVEIDTDGGVATAPAISDTNTIEILFPLPSMGFLYEDKNPTDGAQYVWMKCEGSAPSAADKESADANYDIIQFKPTTPGKYYVIQTYGDESYNLPIRLNSEVVEVTEEHVALWYPTV
ncbi:MAG: hypothetical protein LBM87_00585 [Ruminococcus sp.]|nr:hypothetical protein [Ruminococcus sp.]